MNADQSDNYSEAGKLEPDNENVMKTEKHRTEESTKGCLLIVAMLGFVILVVLILQATAAPAIVSVGVPFIVTLVCFPILIKFDELSGWHGWILWVGLAGLLGIGAALGLRLVMEIIRVF